MNWKKLVKNNSFIYNYLEDMQKTETPVDFDFWTAMFIVSILTNRDIFIETPYEKIYPNLFITLISDDPLARKEFCLKNIENLKHNYPINCQLFNLFPNIGKFLYNIMHISSEHAVACVHYYSNNLLSLYKNKNILNIVNDFYNNPTERNGYGFVDFGMVRIRNVFMSILTTTNSDNYLKAMSEEETEEGYTSKNIIIYAEKGKKRIPWSNGSISSTTEKCLQRIKSFIHRQTKYKCGITKQAMGRYSTWYKRRRLNSTDPFLRRFEAREHELVLKICILLAINEYRDTINEIDMKNAIEIMQYTKRKGKKFLNNEVFEEPNDQMEKVIKRIQEIIHSKGENGIKHRDLFLRIHNSCTSDDFNYIINFFHEAGIIEKLMPENGKTFYYREIGNIMKANTKNLMKLL